MVKDLFLKDIIYYFWREKENIGGGGRQRQKEKERQTPG